MTALTLAANHDVAGTWALVALICLICAACIVKAIRDETAHRDVVAPVAPVVDEAADAMRWFETENWLENGGAS